MMRRLSLALALIAVALGGCASKILVQELSPDAPAGTKVDGIPVYAPRAYRVHVYMLDTHGVYQEQAPVGGEPVTVPDTSKLYVIGFQGFPLATHTIEIGLNDNGTVDHVNQGSTSNAGDALTQAGASAVAVKTQLDANRAAANALVTAYGTALSDYAAKMQDYCTASHAQPLDLQAVRTKATAVFASEENLVIAHRAYKEAPALPFATLINTETDVGVGCAPAPAPAASATGAQP